MKHIQTFESFLNETETAIKAEKLIGIMNDANKEGSTVSVIKSGKTYELTSFLYMHYKTLEFKTLNGPNVKFKHDDMVKVNESLNEASFVENMNAEALEIYRKYVKLIDVTDKNAINSHDKLNKELSNDEDFQKCAQKSIVQKALNWAITFAIEQER
jgi:hypothetical protein